MELACLKTATFRGTVQEGLERASESLSLGRGHSSLRDLQKLEASGLQPLEMSGHKACPYCAVELSAETLSLIHRVMK